MYTLPLRELGPEAVCLETACLYHIKGTGVLHASHLELAAPFLITFLILFVSTPLFSLIEKRLEEHYSFGWEPDELARVDAVRAPSTHALAMSWAIDAAQIPTIFGTPAAGIFILRKVFSDEFLIAYTGALASGLVIFIYFLTRVKIHGYVRHGVKLWGFRYSPLALAGMGLNLACAIAAPYLVR